MRQLFLTLRAAILPTPTLACLRQAAGTMLRNLREPPRRRRYQKMASLS